MRKRLINFKVIVILISTILSACSGRQNPFKAKQEIPLQVVRQSSSLIHCRTLFGYSVKKLEEENEILIQMGTIDTADEEDPKSVVVIKTNNTERILYCDSGKITMKDDYSLLTQQFTGEGYKLVITWYDTRKPRVIYDATCVITSVNLRSEYKLEGEPNIHDY